MSTRIIVRCVPERPRFIAYLRERLTNTLFYFHPQRGDMLSYRGALTQAGKTAVVLMEDDVILTRDFRRKLERVIAEHRREVVQFFSMRQADVDVGSRYDRNFLMGQCVYLPAGYSQALLTWHWPGEAEQDGSGSDLLLSDWLKSRNEPYWIHVPSLVDHRQGRSVIDPRRSSKRQSKTFTDAWN
jgi:hypothetical protein